MKVNTQILRSMLGRVNSCKASNLLEITNYFELEFTEEGLYINATDGTNYISAFDDTSKGGEGSIIVKADQFTKLINKTTTDEVELKVKSNYLEARGNGTYKVEMVEGEIYPKLIMDEDIEYNASLEDLKGAIVGGKYAKSNVVNDGVLFAYLLRNDNIIAADAIKVYNKNIKGELEGINALISPALANMILSLDCENLKVVTNKDNTLIKFIGQNVVVGGAIMEGADDYPDLTELFEVSSPHTVRLDRKKVIEGIDRLNLFISLYDKGAINLVFTDTTLTLSTMSKSIETVKYLEPLSDDITYVTTVNCKYLQDLLNASTDEEITIGFGMEDLIKLDSADINMLLATTDDE